ncbi:DUF6879 family protein [Nocardia sp. NBC_01388]|uniref:DUF6879 family protein n=1 Tax=Nocardia sp. NBC_01388 TaxID=2903596 RepID=UPI00324A5732
MELKQSSVWPDLFRRAKRSAFHMEVRDAYAVPGESEPLRRFLNGQPRLEDDESWSAWGELIREVTGRGVAVTRVRVVTVPHSDYQRWLLTETYDNVAAGEDIRYLPRHLVAVGEVPADDWWLFDDEMVAFNLIDAEGRPAGVGVTTDRHLAAVCKQSRERLWLSAIPFADYVKSAV